ncbi:MAG TPA: CBS domain-containing protein [Balneolaceae bacterium]|nr:CBS domain-containing protein [Balneolaceae bacterium]
MGDEEVKFAENQEEVQQFMKAVLRDIRALDEMLQGNWFEDDPIRIGAEQEMCLVDSHSKAWPMAMEVLKNLDDEEHFTTEFAQFNLEINAEPVEFTGSCLSKMENNLQKRIDTVRKEVQSLGGDIILTGILPTIRNADIDLKNMTPLQRYRALCDAINKLRGETYELRIQGMDELLMKSNSPLLEACNTGFQVHLQVTPENFVQKYNIAQAITGPVLAAAVGSPFLFGKRLWSETRIALFQQSIDTRTVGNHRRERSSRVSFGTDWVNDSILEIFQEDTARHRMMLSADVTEDVEKLLQEGTPPQLKALQVHNGTIYRWNRPCYGVSNGRAHLRIENRVFPSGPTVVDEIANTAFWLGLLNKMDDYYPDIREVMDFDNAKLNFVAASKLGLDTTFRWVNNERINAPDLITEELLPIAREGLQKASLQLSDIEHYLNIIKNRVESGQTASTWMLNNYSSLMKENNAKEQTLTAITSAVINNQKKGDPVHTWENVRTKDFDEWEPSRLLVEEFMTTDLYTVQEEDILEFAANLIEWQKIQYVPVEDDNNQLVGLITMRILFREYSENINNQKELEQTVGKIMIQNPITIHPEASIIEAMDIMADKEIGCLPVVKNQRLVGMITEQNFIALSSRLLKVLHAKRENNSSDEA